MILHIDGIPWADVHENKIKILLENVCVSALSDQNIEVRET